MKAVMILVGAFLLCSTATMAKEPSVTAVSFVDLARYSGTWFEIGRLPNRFQNDCIGATAEYGLRDDGSVSAVNDRIVGGPGLRRGRRHPNQIVYGDAVDFWRVTNVEVNRRLELRAEMKLPGEAVLEFEVEPTSEHGCRLTQTARFKPRGLFGISYWYAVLPFHGVVFDGMLRGLRRDAENRMRTLNTLGHDRLANAAT
jgi:hypothetical protein